MCHQKGCNNSSNFQASIRTLKSTPVIKCKIRSKFHFLAPVDSTYTVAVGEQYGLMKILRFLSRLIRITGKLLLGIPQRSVVQGKILQNINSEP